MSNNENSPISGHSPRKKWLNKFKLIRIILIVVGVSLLLAIVVLFTTNRIAVVVNDNHQAGSVGQVCGSDFVNKYNSIMTKQFKIDEQTDYKEKTEELLKSVQGHNNYNNDPTCQYVEFTYHMSSNFDYSKAKESFDRLNDLVASGVYINSNVYGLTSIGDMLNNLKEYEKYSKGEYKGESAE